MVCVGQKLNTAWLGGSGSGSGSGSLTSLKSRCWLRLKSSRGSTMEESFSKVTQWLLADLKPSLGSGPVIPAPYHVSFSTEQLTTRQLVSIRVSRQKDKRASKVCQHSLVLPCSPLYSSSRLDRMVE